jgi:hypothetical protein
MEKQLKKNEFSHEDYGKTLASWDFPEFVKYKRTISWYVVAAIFGLAIIIYAIWISNYLFAFIVIIIAFIILLYEIKEPVKINFSITEDGLELGDHFYPYKEIKNFWIIYEPPEVKKLYFEFKSGFRPKLSISLLDQNPLEVRKVLIGYLSEDLEKEEESTTDLIERKFKL